MVLCIDLNNFISYDAKNDSFKNQLLSFFPNAITIVDNNVLSILIEENQFNNISIIDLTQFCSKNKLIIGCSDAFNDLYDFNVHQLNALSSVVNSEYLIDNHNFIIEYDQVRVFDFISKSNREYLLSCCKNVINEIYKYDQSKNSEFLKTLYIYLATKHSVRETSNILYLHRNTITYRIKKIKDLFGIDFDNRFLEFEYIFSCQIIQVIENNFLK